MGTKIAGQPDHTLQTLLDGALKRIKKRINLEDMSVFEVNEFGFTFPNSDEFQDATKFVKDVVPEKNGQLYIKMKPKDEKDQFQEEEKKKKEEEERKRKEEEERN